MNIIEGVGLYIVFTLWEHWVWIDPSLSPAPHCYSFKLSLPALGCGLSFDLLLQWFIFQSFCCHFFYCRYTAGLDWDRLKYVNTFLGVPKRKRSPNPQGRVEILWSVPDGFKYVLCLSWCRILLMQVRGEHENKCRQNIKYLNAKVCENWNSLNYAIFRGISSISPSWAIGSSHCSHQKPARAGSVHFRKIKGGDAGQLNEAFVDGLLGSCCRLPLPLGGGKYGGNIRRLVIPILTQMLDWGERVAGCWRRKRR